MSPRRHVSPDAMSVGRHDHEYADRIAATEAALAELTENPVVPARPRRPETTTQPLVEAIRQAHEAHLAEVASLPTTERTRTPMTTKEIRTTPDGKKYWHAWNVGDYRVELTIPWSPTVGQWSVTGPDGHTFTTPVDGRDNKWYVGEDRLPSLKAAIDRIVATEAAPAPRSRRTRQAPEAVSPVAEAVRQAVLESAETAEEAAQVQDEARSTRGRRRPRNQGSVLEAGRGPKPPARSTLQRWVRDGIAKATDGCQVEPDGTCAHGKPSWLLELGLI